MRSQHCEVKYPAEIDGILRSSTIGRMATNGVDGYPYITAVNYVWHEGCIYFHSARTGEKLDNILRDPKVCFEVDVPLAYIDAGYEPEKGACGVHQFYHCVVIRGEAGVVPEGLEKTGALNALVAAHEKRSDCPLVTDDMPAYRACTVVRIKTRSISAKSDLRQNKTPQERAALARYLMTRNRPGDQETAAAMGCPD
ncbi:MAG: pyridoxamine 5'-phosphate oxidase family protein [Pseudomonadota bacterium]